MFCWRKLAKRKRDALIPLCDELDDTTVLLDLALSLLADISGLDDHGDVGETALAKELGVAEGEKIEDKSLVLGSVGGEVLLAGLLRDKSHEL